MEDGEFKEGCIDDLEHGSIKKAEVLCVLKCISVLKFPGWLKSFPIGNQEGGIVG